MTTPSEMTESTVPNPYPAIGENQYRDAKRRFFRYVKPFAAAEPTSRQGIILKIKHSVRVAVDCRTIAAGLGLPAGSVRMARLVGLVHDIGRFEQYATYRTFVDRDSVDHGELGVQILRRHPILSGLDATTRSMIETAVAMHNRAHIPAGISDGALFFTRLVRDADKLDIYRIIIAHYLNGKWREVVPTRIASTGSGGPSPQVVAALCRQRTVDMAHVRSRDDLLLLRIGWVFDMNFDPTFRMLAHRGLLDRLFDGLPPFEALERLRGTVDRYVRERIRGSSADPLAAKNPTHATGGPPAAARNAP